MGIPYTKKPLTFEQQLAQLEGRGMAVRDRNEALRTLRRISYYRLSAYWLPFKNTDDSFVRGASFEQAVALYDFDRRLRLLVLDGIERVEVALRTEVTYHLAHKYGSYSHCDPAHFRPRQVLPSGKVGWDHAAWYADVEKEIARAKERFVEHFKAKYDGFPKIPIWMASELMSLGSLSQLFKGLNVGDQDAIAQTVKVHRRVAASWFHTFTFIRNVCAHHGRLWNRELSIRPEIPKEGRMEWVAVQPKRVYAVLCMVRHATANDHGEAWVNRVRDLLRETDPYPDRRGGMGVPHDWAQSEFWRGAAVDDEAFK